VRRAGRSRLAALLVLAVPLSVSAAVDLNGHFVSTLLFHGVTSSCDFDVTQSGSAITLNGHCPDFVATGTIDSTTGAFTATAPPGPACDFNDMGLQISGAGAADGYTFEASVNCLGIPAFAFATRCGNGEADAGEQTGCDAAVAGGGFNCCDAHCQYRPSGTICHALSMPGSCDTPATCSGSSATCPDTHLPDGSPCSDSNVCTTGDVCMGGTCVGTPAPQGTTCGVGAGTCVVGACDGAGSCQTSFLTGPCDDGDPCTSGDTCSGGQCVGGPPTVCPPCEACYSYSGCIPSLAQGCKRPDASKAALTIKDRTPDGRDRVQWKWAPGTSSVEGFGDPVSQTDYDFCVFDLHTAPIEILTRAHVPAGASWRAFGFSSFRYADATRAAGGLQSIRLRGADKPGKARITLKGRGSNLGLPPSLAASEPPYLVVQLQAENGNCWGADYTSARKNTPGDFQSRSGSPAGAFLDR